MSKELTPYQQKALSLRDYLSRPQIKSQVSDALPKWLSPDRFFRVVFGAILRNPKLVECSTESILQSVMYCAQLGVEPILGRAYLVPYAQECQAQIGYQGLVDIARRSNTIADIWGASVHENDEFDLSYGMERNLVHRPWFMDPAKRKEGQPGECLGTYVVWQLKDGTKHPEFMPLHEIHKRREVSQSYRWAETGDPKRGGGKKDSIWHKWPEEQQLKTVIKHSSKLVPANIEFMEAVQLDDDEYLGGSHALFLPERPALPPPGGSFDEVFATELADPLFAPWAEDLIKRSAENEKKSLEETRAAFIDQAKQVRGLFAKWKAERMKAPPTYQMSPDSALPATKTDPPAETKTETKETPLNYFRSQWINLKEAGFSTFVFKNIDGFKALQGDALAEALAKWKKIYPSFSCPFVERKASEDTTEPAAEPQNDAVAPVSSTVTPSMIMEAELARLKAEIAVHSRANADLVHQAMGDVGIAHPTTIDGCRVVLEAIAARLKG